MKNRATAELVKLENNLKEAFRRFLTYLPDRVDEAVANPEFKNIEFLSLLLDRIERKRWRKSREALAWANVAVRLAAGLGDIYFVSALEALSATNLSFGRKAEARNLRNLAAFVDPTSAGRPYLLRLVRLQRLDEAKKVALRALVLAQGTGGQTRGCALVNLGIVHESAAEFYEASCRFMEALPCLKFRDGEDVYSRAVQGLSNGINQCEEVRPLWEKGIEMLRQEGCTKGSHQWYLLRWLEGMFDKRCLSSGTAYPTLRAAWSGLVQGGDPLESFFITLDFVEICVRRRSYAEAGNRLRDAIGIVRNPSLESELNALFSAPIRKVKQERILQMRNALYRRFLIEGALPCKPS